MSDVKDWLPAARRFLALTETGPDYKRAKRQMLNYLDDELFLGLESELEGIVDWDWLTRAIVDAALVVPREQRRKLNEQHIESAVLRGDE